MLGVLDQSRKLPEFLTFSAKIYFGQTVKNLQEQLLLVLKSSEITLRVKRYLHALVIAS